MIGEYKIDESQLFDSLKSRLYFLFKKILPFLLLLFIVGIIIKERLMTILFGGMSFVIVIIYYLTPYYYNSKKDSLSKLTIIIGENELCRKGDGLINTKILFEEIGDVKERDNGIHILRKGVINQFMFYRLTYTGTEDPNIIWIPKEIEHYAEIKEFIFDKYYSAMSKT